MSSVKIRNDPANRNPATFSVLIMYTKKAQTKLDKIARQITELLSEKRIANGDTINDAGYTGRKKNKR